MDQIQPEDFAQPVAKRQKLEPVEQEKPRESRIFAPFRTIGLVSPTKVPFTTVPLGKTTFQVTTSTGRNIQTYDLRRGLNLVFLSRPICPEDITATVAHKNLVFVAWGNQTLSDRHGVWVFKRGRLIGELETSDVSTQIITSLLVFGSWVIGVGASAIEVWRSDTYEHHTTIIPGSNLPQHDDTILSGCVCTLPILLNKIFVGRKDGSVDIFNVNTGKFIYKIQTSTGKASVTALAAGPAPSILAIGYEDGTVVIMDAETEEVILRFAPSSNPKPITSITFRTDDEGAGEDGRKAGIMATASIESGDITLFDLNKGGKIAGILRGAHALTQTNKGSGITGIEFLPGQPVLISTGLDNSVKSWIFDQVPFSPLPRPLHTRQGHSASITALKFLPAASDGSEANGKWLLSAGKDRSLWGFSLRKDGQSTEISQGRVQHKAKKQGRLSNDDSSNIEDLKCPPIISMACSLNRDGGMGAVSGPVWTNPKSGSAEVSGMTGWESVVTAHENDRYARTWFWGRKKAGRWAFETGDKNPVTSVMISVCGTFAIIGSSGGSLDMFNLQSGQHRQRFPPKLNQVQAKQIKINQAQGEQTSISSRGHKDGVTGIIVDNLNQTVVSTGLDGQMIFWDFVSGQVRERLSFHSTSAASIRYNPVSNLIAVACDDTGIRIVDMETRRTVRELWGCVGQIYDHCFSHDGRWIVSCSMDSVIRVFDLATGHLIDAFKTATCTNLAFSSTGEFLATAHAGNIGISIWNNKSLFMHVPTRQIDEDKGIIDLTNSSQFNATSQLSIDSVERKEVESEQGEGASALDQLNESLLTLSLIPRSKWQTLLHLETIRERNKPIQPPEKPKAAPFFLGSTITNGTNGTTSSTNQELEVSKTTEQSRISKLASLQSSTSTFSRHLENASQDSHNLNEITEYLATLSPSAADLDIRSLTMSEMPTFIAALRERLRQKRDFELVNTWMSVFLKIHGEFVSGIDEIGQAVLEYHQAMKAEEARLGQSLGWARGVLEFLRSAR